MLDFEPAFCWELGVGDPGENTDPITATAAQSFLSERQTDFPPWHGTDRVRQLFEKLAPALPPKIREMHRIGQLALGEVGALGIRAKRENLGNGEFSLELYSGLLEFFGLLSDIVSGSGTHTEGKATRVENAVISKEERIKMAAAVFTDWKDGNYSRRFVRPAQNLTDAGTSTATLIATAAVTFVIAHELGHVDMETDETFDPDLEDCAQVETRADRFAVQSVMRAAQWTEQYRAPFAGALFAVRVFAFLERLGAAFPGPHPAPHTREAQIKEFVREQFGEDFAYVKVSTVALSIDEFFASLENFINGKGVATEQTLERVEARLWAILEAAAQDQITPDGAQADLCDGVADVPPEILRTAAEHIFTWAFSRRLGGHVLRPGGLMSRMGAILSSASPQFPQPARDLFLAAQAKIES